MQRRVITDVRVLAALGHPVRARLLGHLVELGPSTATECAADAGVSPSACSYHLRHLERFGLVERVQDASDGRNRPWRAVATGYSIGPSPSTHDIVTRTATFAAVSASVAATNDLAETFLAGVLALSDEWQDAAEFNSYGLAVDADELRTLTAAIDALVRPYLAATRTDAPPGARNVHVTVQAFPRDVPR
ncbi:helix-turn-helix domain-containing protein [soil metagenome]